MSKAKETGKSAAERAATEARTRGMHALAELLELHPEHPKSPAYGQAEEEPEDEQLALPE